nr:hypothetical protein [uncultured bacterium]
MCLDERTVPAGSSNEDEKWESSKLFEDSFFLRPVPTYWR